MRRIVRDQRGNISVLAALTGSLVVAGAGFGVETGYWFYDATRLQQAADAAAYAASVELRAGSNASMIDAAARKAAGDNGWKTTDAITITTPASVGGEPDENAVKVELGRTQVRMFSALFSQTPMVVKAEATAAFATQADACVLALHKSANDAINFSGNTSATFDGCVVMSNSMASDAVNTQGSAEMAAACAVAVGGVDLGADSELACGAALTQQPPAADPFRSIPEPSLSGTCKNGNAASLSPGRYCDGMTLKNNTSLAPGVYVITGGTFNANANANVTGTGVTIFLANGTSVSINGNATLNLSAPTSGDYRGILFMGGRTNANNRVTFNGTAASKFTGAIYFPAQDVSYLGNFSGQNGCTQVVARTVEWSGSTTVEVDCSDLGLRDITVGGLIRLVG